MSRSYKFKPDCQKYYSNWQLLAFSSPYLGSVFLTAPMGVVQGIYAKYYGLELTTIAAVLLVGRVFDALTDPLVGYCSDRAKRNSGTRKPLVFLGGVGLLICSYFLYSPPSNVSVIYFTVWTLLFYFFTTLKTIPTNAWASELSRDMKERTRIFTVVIFASTFGSLLFYLVPFFPIFETSEITPDTLRLSVFFGFVLLLPGLVVALLYMPDGPAADGDLLTIDGGNRVRSRYFYGAFLAIKNNKPFQIFVMAHMCTGLGLGMFYGLFFIFVDAYLGYGAAYSGLAAVGILGGIFLVPLANKAILIAGKKAVWLALSIIMAICFLYAGQIVPGDDVAIELLLFQVISVFGSICLSIIAMTTLSEIVDYAQIKDSSERRGFYFSLLSMMVKTQGALGMALGLAIAGLLGFDATVINHNENSAFAIRISISWIPSLVLFVGVFFIWLSPLNERRTGIVARRLNERSSNG